MASIVKEFVVDARPDEVWDALADFAAIDQRVARGFVVESALVTSTTRQVTFFNGAVAQEALVSRDDARRRLAYSVVDSALGFAHHNAVVQLSEDVDGRTQFVWTADVLPDALAEPVENLMELGSKAIRETLEADAHRGVAS
jgi:carbon monoxide dehydrogenase subunit G